MSPAFLGVEKSLTGRRWIARSYDERIALAFSQRYSLPDMLARSLASRNLDIDEVPSFLSPRLRDSLPDPFLFKDMEKAASRFAEALKSGEKIAVFGDFDVDGATSSALMLRFARAVGHDLRLYIPDRLNEGYGPNIEAIKQLAEEGHSLIVFVDCGTGAHESLAFANSLGIDTIVIDHHTAEPDLPLALAIVNPNRLDDPMSSEYGALAAVGVCYLFLIAVNRILRESGFYKNEKQEPDLLRWLDLVALGTVCDVAVLKGLNRVFVSQGLKVMKKRGNVGLTALLLAAGLKKEPDEKALGFIIGPRINAGGRIGKSDIGARLLATDDPEEASALTIQLDEMNAKRRDIESDVLSKADSLVFTEDSSPVVFAASENWHSGVLGIVAARLREKYKRPAIVIGIDGEIGKGSGRSVSGIDLGAAVIAAKQAGLLVSGGGHKMAAGLTVLANKIGDFREFIIDRISKQLASEPLAPSLVLDGLAAGPSLNAELIEKLGKLAPFGVGNPEPCFALADCKIIHADLVGQKHIRVIVSNGSKRISCIAFRAAETGIGNNLLSSKNNNSLCHLAGYLRPDTYRGNGAVQFIIEDAALSIGQ